MIKSIQGLKKIILFAFVIKQDKSLLLESGFLQSDRDHLNFKTLIRI